FLWNYSSCLLSARVESEPARPVVLGIDSSSHSRCLVLRITNQRSGYCKERQNLINRHNARWPIDLAAAGVALYNLGYTKIDLLTLQHFASKTKIRFCMQLFAPSF